MINLNQESAEARTARKAKYIEKSKHLGAGYEDGFYYTDAKHGTKIDMGLRKYRKKHIEDPLKKDYTDKTANKKLYDDIVNPKNTLERKTKAADLRFQHTQKLKELQKKNKPEKSKSKLLTKKSLKVAGGVALAAGAVYGAKKLHDKKKKKMKKLNEAFSIKDVDNYKHWNLSPEERKIRDKAVKNKAYLKVAGGAALVAGAAYGAKKLHDKKKKKKNISESNLFEYTLNPDDMRRIKSAGWLSHEEDIKKAAYKKAGKVAGGVALAAGAAYGAKKLHDKKKKKKNISESELFENYQNLNEFSLNPFKRKSNIHHAEKYFNKTLKKAAKGKASSGDVDRARRTLMSLKKPKS
jgi:hypothetical protein